MSTRRLRNLLPTASLLALLAAPPAQAEAPATPPEALAERLKPIAQAPALRRPALLEAAAARPAAQRCAGLDLPLSGELPFTPGEELAYDMSVAGVNVGHLETKVGRYRNAEGRKLLTLFGRARTNSFLAVFKRFEGRYESLVDPQSFAPMKLRVEAEYGDDKRWERGRFSKENTVMSAAFLLNGKEGTRSYELGEPMSDVLSLLYAARTRRLIAGHAMCQQVFGARWMWRMEATVLGTGFAETPAGRKAATVVRAIFSRTPHKDVNPNAPFQKIEMDIYYSQDRPQVPLLFSIRTDKINAEAKLVRWSLRAQDDDAWEL